MHTRKFVLLIAAALLTCLGASAQTARLNHRYDMFKSIGTSDATLGAAFGKDFETTVFVGTSVVSQFPWEEAFYTDPEDASKRRIIDRGVWQATILDILNNIESIITLHPAKIFLMAGVNDGMDDAKNIDVFIDNYRQVLHRLVNETNATIYVQSILPATADGRKLAVIREANSRLQVLTTETEFAGTKVSFIPLFDEVGDVTDPALTPDGLHFSVIGYEKWVNAIKSALSKDYHVFNAAADFKLKSVENVFGGSSMAIGDLRNSFYANMPVNADDVLLIGGETICCGNWSELLGNYRVLNRGYGWDDAGVRIDQVKESLPYILGYNYEKGNNHPKRVVLYIGLGDIASDDITLEKAKDNYADLVHEIRTECPSTPITLVKLLNITPLPDITDANIAEFNNAMANLVAEENNIDLIDLTAGSWTYVKKDATPEPQTTTLSHFKHFEEVPSSEVYIEKASEDRSVYDKWSSTVATRCEVEDKTSNIPTGWVNIVDGDGDNVVIELIDEDGDSAELEGYVSSDGTEVGWYWYNRKGNPFLATVLPETLTTNYSPVGYHDSGETQPVTDGNSVDLGITLHKWVNNNDDDDYIWLEEKGTSTVDVYYQVTTGGVRLGEVNIGDYDGYESEQYDENIRRYYRKENKDYWVVSKGDNHYDVYTENTTLGKWVCTEENKYFDDSYKDQETSEAKITSYVYPTTPWAVTAPSFKINDTAYTDGTHVLGKGYLCLADMLGELLHNIDELTVNVPKSTSAVVDARDLLASRVLVAETRANAYTHMTDQGKANLLKALATEGYGYLAQDPTTVDLTTKADSLFEETHKKEPSTKVSEFYDGWYQIINIDAHTYNAGEGRVLAADSEMTSYGGSHEAIFTTKSDDVRSFVHINNIAITGSGKSCTANLQLINGRYIGAGGTSSETAATAYIRDDESDAYRDWKVLTLSDANDKFYDITRHEGKLLLVSQSDANAKSYFKVFGVSDIINEKYDIVNVVIKEAPEGTAITYTADGYQGLPAYNGGYFFVAKGTASGLSTTNFSSITEAEGVTYELVYAYDNETHSGTVTLQPHRDFTAVTVGTVKATGWFQLNVATDPANNDTHTVERYVCATAGSNATFTLAKKAPTTFVYVENGESVGKFFLRTIDQRYIKYDGTVVNSYTDKRECEFTITPTSDDSGYDFTIDGLFDNSLNASKVGENVYLSNGTAITFQACNIPNAGNMRQVTTTYTQAADEDDPDMSGVLVTYNPEGGYLGLPVNPNGYIQLTGAFKAADFTVTNIPEGCICTSVEQVGNAIQVNIKKVKELTDPQTLPLTDGWYQMVLHAEESDAAVTGLAVGNVIGFQLTPAEGADCGMLIADTDSPATYVKVALDAETGAYTLRMPNGLYIGADGKGAAEAYNFTLETCNGFIAVKKDASTFLSVASGDKTLCANNLETVFAFHGVEASKTAGAYTVNALPDGVEMITWAPAEGYTGSSVCAEGGVFFTNTAPAASEFNVTSSAVTAANGYADTSVDVDGVEKTVTVKDVRYLYALAVAESLQRNGYATVTGTDDEKSDVTSAISDFTGDRSDTNYANLVAALGKLKSKTFKLESGHAYRIKVANSTYGANYGDGMAYLTSNNGALSTTQSVATDLNGNSIFVCRTFDDPDSCILVTHTGDYYMNYRSNSTQNGTSHGYEDKSRIVVKTFEGNYRDLLGLATINAEGKYITLTSDPENPRWTATDTLANAKFGNGYTSAFIFEDVTAEYNADNKVKFNEVTMLEEEITGKQYAYATKYLPYSYELPDNVTAYIVPTESLTKDYEFTIRSIDYKKGAARIVPANTAVVLRVDLTDLATDEAKGIYNMKLNGTKVYTLLPAAATAEIANDNLNSNALKGTCVPNTAVATVFNIDYAVLGIRLIKSTATDPEPKELGQVLFAKMSTAAKAGILPKAKAFLGVDLTHLASKDPETRAMANAFMNITNWTFGAGVATDIDEFESTTTDNSGIYDISGRKVESTAKGGFYIVKGKKVVIK